MTLLQVYRTDETTRTPLLHIEGDLMQTAWHTARTSVRSGRFRLEFKVEFVIGSKADDKNPMQDFGVDDIKLERGLCTTAG